MISLDKNFPPENLEYQHSVSPKPSHERSLYSSTLWETTISAMGLCGNCKAWQDGSQIRYQADPDIAGIGVSLDIAIPAASTAPKFDRMAAHV